MNLFNSIKDENLHKLHGKKKIQYILDYYKLPLILLVILLYAAGHILYGRFTHKETVLYTALVNVNADEALSEELQDHFIDYLELPLQKNKLELQTGLYLTINELNEYYEYSYASQVKIMAMINDQEVDAALMNKEAFDAFSQSGYLCDLKEFLAQEDPGLLEEIEADLTANIIVLSDNSIDVALDPTIPYNAETEEHLFGVDLSRTNLFPENSWGETVYFGIISNSPRKDTTLEYLRYLLFAEQEKD